MTLFRFGLKVGIVGGAVYYSNKLGVWDDSSKTYELSQQIVAAAKPYLAPAIDTMQKELPTQVKNLPSTDDICQSFATSWNRGVIYSIAFIRDIPEYTSSYLYKGFNYVVANLEKEKIIPPREKSS